MQSYTLAEKRRLKWALVALTAGLVGSTGLLLLHFFPEQRQLVLLGLYSIPSHMFISPFPHEPALLYCAKFYSAWEVTIAATIGCCFAGLFDYWFLIPLLNHRAVRPKFENTRLFQRSLAFFHKSPFWMLVIAGYTPIPFYPFKFLSIAGGYPLWKYQAALVVGRAPRYYTLAVLGYLIQPPTWTLIILAFAGVIVGAVRKLLKNWRLKSPERPARAEAEFEGPLAGVGEAN